MSRTALLVPLAVLLLAAAPAQAIYVVTDLEVFVQDTELDAGDTAHFTVGPANESVVGKHAGKTYRVVYTHDPEQEGGEAVSGEVGTVTLDDAAKGAFEWTIPASAQDKNVAIAIMDGDEPVGHANVPVGDAPPVLMASGGGPADSGPVDESAPEGTTPARDAPGFTALAIVGAAAIAVGIVALRHGRR